MPDATWHYAVVVGVDEYPQIDGGAYNLRCPLNDVDRMENWLTSPQGGNLDPSRVKTITRTAPGGRNPPVPIFDEINSAILECVSNFVSRRKSDLPDEASRKAAWLTSRFYLYISGHGMDGDGDDAVLITANATRVSLNHISTRNVLNRLKLDKIFAEFVILADCCRDLAGVAVQDLPWDLRNYTGFNDPSLPRSFVAYASRNRRKAFEPPPGAAIQNGLFTHALLEGLNGGVAGNLVDSSSLAGFLYNYIPDLARQLSVGDQNPDIKYDPNIVFVNRSKDYTVKLFARPGSAFVPLPSVDALVLQGAVIISRKTIPSCGPGEFFGSLETGYYAIVPPGGDPMQGAPVHPLAVLGKDTNESIG